MNQNIIDSLEHNYMPYTAHVILQRALPEIDGFKPSQRRILYTMYNMNLLGKLRKKSQSIVGQTMFLHAHGDSSIYETLVRMSKDNESLLMPYIDSKGNFGKVYSRDMKEASPRYTEAKLSSISKELFNGIDENAVDMIDNYDGTLKEPRFLPSAFPNILTNSQSGTAVGMASNIPSFNLGEVIDFTIAYIKNQNSPVSDYIKAPDFPTGGSVIYNKELFDKIYSTGRGSFKIRANYEIKDDSIIFYDVPYTTTFEAIMDRISLLVKDGKIKDIIDIDDIHGINSKGIEITVKKNTNKEELIERLFSMTSLEDSFGCNFNVIIEGSPKVLGIKSLIDYWIKYRASTLVRVFKQKRLKKMNKRHLLSALKQVTLDIDNAIKIIRETKKNSEVVEMLMASFSITEEQAEYVADIRLRNLNKEYLLDRINEIEKLNKEIEELDDLINNKKTLAKYIINDLTRIKDTYAEERKTSIIDESEIKEITVNNNDIIDDYNVRFFITKDGYLKKVPLTSLRGNYSIRVKDGDEVINEIETTNDSEILVFTDKKNVYKYKSYEMSNHKPSELGEYMHSFLELDDENILYMTVTNSFAETLVIGFDDGKLALINLSSYKTKQNRTLLKNGYADKNAIYFNTITHDIDLIAISTDTKAVLLNTDKFNQKAGRTSGGSNFIRLKDGEKVDKFIEVSDNDDLEYYRLNSAGVGKFLKDDFNKK